MLTPSVNLVQGAFSEEKQGEISGLSRSVSNLGSSFGTAIAGTILVSNLVSGNGTYVAAMIVLAVLALVGLGASILLPANPLPTAHADAAPPRGRVGPRGVTWRLSGSRSETRCGWSTCRSPRAGGPRAGSASSSSARTGASRP